MFCSHGLFEWVDTQHNVHYCVGLSGNKSLLSHPAVIDRLAKVENDFRRYKEHSKSYTQFLYKASTWEKARWIIVKAEYGPLGKNIRFIVTDRTPKNSGESKKLSMTKHTAREVSANLLSNR